jgi:hypothetical protein
MRALRHALPGPLRRGARRLPVRLADFELRP